MADKQRGTRHSMNGIKMNQCSTKIGTMRIRNRCETYSFRPLFVQLRAQRRDGGVAYVWSANSVAPPASPGDRARKFGEYRSSSRLDTNLKDEEGGRNRAELHSDFGLISIFRSVSNSRVKVSYLSIGKRKSDYIVLIDQVQFQKG